LIYGDQDAVLVDTYTSIEQNAELVQWVRSFGKRLTYAYITHGHGDHFFGIGQLQEAFPEAGGARSSGLPALPTRLGCCLQALVRFRRAHRAVDIGLKAGALSWLGGDVVARAQPGRVGHP
jgi:glyoxylase-like metal-dependent hydrolase (beta-lactamase superfamily II)